LLKTNVVTLKKSRNVIEKKGFTGNAELPASSIPSVNAMTVLREPNGDEIG
jgi:hypothetical protein